MNIYNKTSKSHLFIKGINSYVLLNYFCHVAVINVISPYTFDMFLKLSYF